MTLRELTAITEKVIKKRVVRNGVKKIVRTSNRPGYKVVDGEEVKISPQEKINRKKATKRAVLKRKKTTVSANAQRKRSMARR